MSYFWGAGRKTHCVLYQKSLKGFISLAIKLSWSASHTGLLSMGSKQGWALLISCLLMYFHWLSGEPGSLLCCSSGRCPWISHEAGIEGSQCSQPENGMFLSSMQSVSFSSITLSFFLLRNIYWAPAMCQPFFTGGYISGQNSQEPLSPWSWQCWTAWQLIAWRGSSYDPWL